MLFIFAIGTNGKFRSIYAYKMMLVLGFIDLVRAILFGDTFAGF